MDNKYSEAIAIDKFKLLSILNEKIETVKMSTSIHIAVPLEPSEECQEQASTSTDNEPDDRNDSGDGACNSPEHHSTQPRSTGRSLLDYINSGPMSEGHIRLYNGDSRPSDPSQNLCLFTPCLLIVGCTILSIGKLCQFCNIMIVNK